MIKRNFSAIRLMNTIYLFEQRRFATSVWPNDSYKLTRFCLQINIGNNPFALNAKRHLFNIYLHYDPPPNEYELFLNNQMKNGPPLNEVTTPIGISSGATINLATTSAQIIKTAPRNRLIQSTFL